MTDFFNYGLTEEDWMDYAQHQLMIRQELTDASRQRRPVDPTLVPVTPKTPNKQTPKVAVADGDSDDAEDNGSESPDANNESGPVVGPVGPVLVKRENDKPAKEKSEGPDNENKKFTDVHVGSGGAWGAGAAPGSLLAKLIEEQERQSEAKNADSNIGDTSRGQAMDEDSKYGHGTSHDASHDNQGWNQESQGDQDWNNQGHQSHHDWNSQSQNHGGQQDWNSRGSYGQQQWNQHHNNHRGGGGGGRGYHGGRGGRGGYNNDYGGRGRDRSHQSGSHWGGGGGGDYQQRKRPRDDYDNNRYGR
jgi:hypothetical protein